MRHDAPDQDAASTVAGVRRAVEQLLEALLLGADHSPDLESVDELARLVQLTAVAAHVAVGRRSTDVEEAAVRLTQALHALRDDPDRRD